MAGKLKIVVANAATVQIKEPVTFAGFNTYTLASNYLSWDSAQTYRLTDIANTFGDIQNNLAITTSTIRNAKMVCGSDTITTFDFGLLYCIFCAMNWAKSETDSLISIVNKEGMSRNFTAIWINCYLVLYSIKHNYILPITTSDLVKVLRWENTTVKGFTDNQTYTLSREGDSVMLFDSRGNFLGSFEFSDKVRSTYKRYFGTVDNNVNPEDVGILPDSPLSEMLMQNKGEANLNDIFAQYAEQSYIGNAVNREDMIFTPTTRYKSLETFFGSNAYTDKGKLIMPVNWRNGLLIYTPWFGHNDMDDQPEILTSTQSQLNEFYDVTDECSKIAQFAVAIKARPQASYTIQQSTLMDIKDQFFDMKLQRLSFAGAIGKVVIPEEVLYNALVRDNCSEIFTVLPIGAIGNNIVVISPSGSIEVSDEQLTLKGFYYDVSEVV